VGGAGNRQQLGESLHNGQNNNLINRHSAILKAHREHLDNVGKEINLYHLLTISASCSTEKFTERAIKHFSCAS
jgi:GH18 family chitinase